MSLDPITRCAKCGRVGMIDAATALCWDCHSAPPPLDPKCYLTVTTKTTQHYYCNYCGAETTVDLESKGVEPFDGKTDILEHEDDCDRIEDLSHI